MTIFPDYDIIRTWLGKTQGGCPLKKLLSFPEREFYYHPPRTFKEGGVAGGILGNTCSASYCGHRLHRSNKEIKDNKKITALAQRLRLFFNQKTGQPLIAEPLYMYIILTGEIFVKHSLVKLKTAKGLSLLAFAICGNPVFMRYSTFSSAAGAASLKRTSPFSRTHSYLCFAATEPSRICSESLSSTLVWIARRRGLAP